MHIPTEYLNLCLEIILVFVCLFAEESFRFRLFVKISLGYFLVYHVPEPSCFPPHPQRILPFVLMCLSEKQRTLPTLQGTFPFSLLVLVKLQN